MPCIFGGVCAADTLRALGVEVLPMFDEVDGTFPNHHPDPSEPENLKDLIESVQLMDADIGVAFDGDADRLGVVVGEPTGGGRRSAIRAALPRSRNALTLPIGSPLDRAASAPG